MSHLGAGTPSTPLPGSGWLINKISKLFGKDQGSTEANAERMFLNGVATISSPRTLAKMGAAVVDSNIAAPITTILADSVPPSSFERELEEMNEQARKDHEKIHGKK